jgi:uncharacterized protein YgiM (DUF1202 family)
MNSLQRSLIFQFVLILSPFITLPLRHEATAAETTKETPYVTTADAELRKGPGAKYDLIRTIPRDTKIDVVSKEGAWLKVQSKYGQETGYVDGQYARPIAGAATKSKTSLGPGAYITTGEVNLREGPGTKFKVLRRVPKDTRINVVRIDGDWLRVESKKGNPPGYIDKRFAEKMQ